MAWSSAELTDSGLELLSRLMNGGKLTITRAAVGSKTVAADELCVQTELTAPINAPVSIAGSKELPEKCGRTIFVQIRNSGVTEAARMRQIGIFARTDSESEVLLAIMQDEIGEEIPPYAEFPDFLIEFNAVLVIARTNNITVMTDSGAVATRADLESHNSDETAHSELFARLKRRVVATRLRDPSKPDYGVGGGGDSTGVALITADYTGNAEVTVVLGGKEYDGKNISRDAENAPNGTFIIREEQ